MKEASRQLWRQLRRRIPDSRRQVAESALLHTLKTDLPAQGIVLSFVSIGSEISMAQVNDWLMKEGRLALPRIQGKTLLVYRVLDLETLIPGPHNLFEPDPANCELLPREALTSILVPGIAFDKQMHRLGCGGGYYDRLMTEVGADCWGIGFEEQLSEEELPTERHDQQLDRLVLV